jgi:hypothetical protein
MGIPYHAPRHSGIWDMEDDDLPPRPLQEPPEQTEDFARSLGELAGASVWIVFFLAVAGGLFYLVLRATH